MRGLAAVTAISCRSARSGRVFPRMGWKSQRIVQILVPQEHEDTGLPGDEDFAPVATI